MLYLIGGSPRCGKTKVAKALTQKTHVPWFPADYFGAVVFQYISKNDYAAKFPLSNIHDQDPTNDYLYSNYSPEQIVSFYYTQADSIWAGLKAFIKYAAHDEQDFIIEGYLITPELLSQLDEEVRKSVRAVFLCKEDETDIEAGLKKNIDPGDWLLKNTHENTTFPKVAKMIRTFGERTKKEADSAKMPVFNMDGNFENKIDEVTKYLLSK